METRAFAEQPSERRLRKLLALKQKKTAGGTEVFMYFPVAARATLLIKGCAVDNPSTRDIHTSYTKPKPTKHAHICSATVTFASLRLLPATHRTEKNRLLHTEVYLPPPVPAVSRYAGHAFDGCVAFPDATRPGCTSSPLAHRVRKGRPAAGICLPQGMHAGHGRDWMHTSVTPPQRKRWTYRSVFRLLIGCVCSASNKPSTV